MNRLPLVGALQKPVQVVQPLQLNATPHFSIHQQPNVQSYSNHSFLHSTMIPQNSPLVRSTEQSIGETVSGSVPSYVSTTSAYSSPSFSMVPSLNCLQQNTNEATQLKQGVVSPYVYQGLSVGHPIVLTNPNPGGLVYTQHPNRLPAPYMFAQNQTLCNPQSSMIPLPTGQIIPGSMPLGAMAVVLAPNSNNNSGLIQISDNRVVQSNIPLSSSSMTNLSPISFTTGSNLQQSTLLNQNQSGLVCGPSVPGMQQPIINSPFSQVPPGMTLTRLANGAFALSPSCQSISPLSMASFTIQNNTSHQSYQTVTSQLGLPAVQPVSIASVNNPKSKDLNNVSTAEVLRQLNVQIDELQRLSNLSVHQSNRLKQLIEAKERLMKITQNSSGGCRPNVSGVKQPNNVVLSNCIPRPRSTALQPKPIALTPQTQKEIVELLTQNQLLPITQENSQKDFVVGEFRLNSQRYRLRLTRSQKVDLERILANATPVRKSEILAIYQQEQSRYFDPNGNLKGTPVPFVKSQQLQQVRGPFYTAATSTALPTFVSGTAYHPMNAILSSTQQKSLDQFPSQSRPASSIQQPVRLLQTRFPLMPSSSAAPFEKCILAPIVSSSNNKTLMSTGSKVSDIAPAPSTSQLFSITRPSLNMPSVIRPPSLNLHQATRLTNLRNNLHSDHIAAVSKPAHKYSPSPSLQEMMFLLAPYNVLQDLDNTPKAMEKVDDILNNAFKQLNTRKRQTKNAIDSIICSQKWQRMECELVDNVVSSQLSLDLEKDNFSREKTSYSSFLSFLDEELSLSIKEEETPPTEKIYQHIIDIMQRANFFPLTFDLSGNSKKANLDFLTEICTINNEAKINNDVVGSPGSVPEQTALLNNIQSDVTDQDLKHDICDNVAPPSLNSMKIPKPDAINVVASFYDSDEVIDIDSDLSFEPPKVGTKKFDESFFPWPEWVREEEKEVDEEPPGLDIENVVMEDIDDTENDLKSIPIDLKSQWDPCAFPPLNRHVDSSSIINNISQECLPIESDKLQHSEDPDLDAAIRSIIEN